MRFARRVGNALEYYINAEDQTKRLPSDEQLKELITRFREIEFVRTERSDDVGDVLVLHRPLGTTTYKSRACRELLEAIRALL